MITSVGMVPPLLFGTLEEFLLVGLLQTVEQRGSLAADRPAVHLADRDAVRAGGQDHDLVCGQQLVDRERRDAGRNAQLVAQVAMGARHERAIFTVMLPAAKSGVLAGVVLGIGRAIGETMAVIMVAGNQPRLTGNMLKGIRTMTANIVMEMGYATGLHREALIATGVVLFVFILIINLTFSILKRRKQA